MSPKPKFFQTERDFAFFFIGLAVVALAVALVSSLWTSPTQSPKSTASSEFAHAYKSFERASTKQDEAQRSAGSSKYIGVEWASIDIKFLTALQGITVPTNVERHFDHLLVQVTQVATTELSLPTSVTAPPAPPILSARHLISLLQSGLTADIAVVTESLR